MKSYAITLILMLFSAPLWAMEFRIQNADLTAAEKSAALGAFAKVTSLLPAKIKSNLNVVNVEFIQTGERHMGRAFGTKIQVNRQLLNPQHQLPENRASRHADASSQLLATLIHEVGHVYDLAFVKDDEMKNLAGLCRDADDVNSKYPECRYFKSRWTSVSTNRQFLRAAGWWINSETNQMRSGNSFEVRSVDRYEYTSTLESFAVNLEYFLLDSEFNCRKPILFKALSELLEHTPPNISDCSKFSQKVMLSGSQKVDETSFRDLDPKRVYQIHWLHAGKGLATMSKFGHSMMRFIVCAPGKPVGPDCLRDTRYHLVLNFRASVEESNINYLDGLNGKYPSILYFSDFFKILNEYTRDEFRELYSYPLNLTAQQVQDLTAAALELHWSYEGKYYFMSNNCATEALNLLKNVLPQNSPLLKMQFTRPDSLFEGLKASGYVGIPQKNAEPYYYGSKYPIYAEALKKLIEAKILPPNLTLDDQSNVDVATRLQWADAAIKSGSKNNSKDLYLLERRNAELSLRNEKARIALEIEKTLQSGTQKQMDFTEEQMLNARKMLARFRSPGHVLGKVGYGRPLESEVSEFLQSSEAKLLDEESSRLNEGLKKAIKARMTDYQNDFKLVAQMLRDLQKGMGLDLENLKVMNEKSNNQSKENQ